ncbi:MAG: MotA/TolQ/ExbB proton channel family protein [Bdellovibrionales bacterium]|nr:MotA/TolQ/ExbB proton channel family protein [Bdellovibrionales bacterium]
MIQDRIFQIAHLADQGVLYLLLGLSCLSLMMIVNRYFTLNKTFNSCIKIKAEVEKSLISSADLIDKEFVGNSLSVLPYQYLHLGLEHVKKHGIEGLDSLTESFKNVYKSKLEKYLSFLATVGSNAPYIGLFGTVLGIMKSFNEMSAQAQGGNSSVMAGISSALIATAAGLLAAIPSVLAYNYFQKQVKYIFETINLLETSLVLSNKREKHGGC